MKKKICLLLAILLLLSSVLGLSSCNKADEGAKEETTAITTYGVENKEDTKLYERVPIGDYDGYTFTILNAKSGYAITDIVPVESQDSLSQAMFTRNSIVKERLNLEIVEESRPVPAYNTVLEEVKKLNQSQSFAFDAIFNQVAYQTPLAQEGAYLAIEDYEAYLDLSKPWWFNDAMDSLKIDGQTCELFGEFHLMYYESIYGMSFNQKKLSESKVEFPYDLVREGKWTLSELKEMMSLVSASSGEENNYGIVGSKDFCTSMITASDFSLIEQDDDKILIPYQNDDTLVNIYESILDFYVSNGDGQTNWIHPDYSSEAYSSGAFKEEKSTYGDAKSIFASGRSAFIADAVGSFRSFRNAEFDYGIIPQPKYNGDQEKYVSFIYSGAASCGVPTSTPDIERTCAVLENLAAFSYKYVKDEYYETVIQLRTVRDNDSIEMLDIIFGHSDMSITRFELDLVYDIGLVRCIRTNLSDGAAEIKSQLDSIKKTSVVSNINSIIDAYKR